KALLLRAPLAGVVEVDDAPALLPPPPQAVRASATAPNTARRRVMRSFMGCHVTRPVWEPPRGNLNATCELRGSHTRLHGQHDHEMRARQPTGRVLHVRPATVRG